MIGKKVFSLGALVKYGLSFMVRLLTDFKFGKKSFDKFFGILFLMSVDKILNEEYLLKVFCDA